MSRLFIIEQSALSVGGHYYAYSQCVALAARRAGLDVTILQNRHFDSTWGVEGSTVIPAFHHTWGRAEQLWIDSWVPGNLAYDYHMAVADAPPGPDDHVLFATLGYAELRNVLRYLLSLPIGSRMPFFHVLLRYDPDVLRNSLGVYGPLFQQVANSAHLRRRVFFHADTDRLSDSFSWLSQIPFTTLPIPFQQENLKQDLAKRSAATEPLVVTYLGDARLEKGFKALPDLVAALWEDYVKPGRIRFVLQSNFNTEGGEPGILAAVQKLGQYPRDTVELLEKPLSTAEYYGRLAQADIVLVPYDAQRYKERSSGILIEAMTAGKPVLTTKRSWMETKVTSDHAVVFDGEDNFAPALQRLVEGYPAYKKAADAIAARWMQWSSGENFIQALMTASDGRRQRDKQRGPHVLYVMDGESLVLRNGAGLLGLTQLRYLDAAGYAVTAIFVMNHRDAAATQIEQWTDTLKQRVSEFDLDGVFIAGTGRLSTNVSRQTALRSMDPFTIAGDLERVRAYDVSLDLVAHVAARNYDVAFLNYVFNAPLLGMLGLGDVPVICETVDIQSFQKAIYGRRRVEERDLALEMKVLAGFSQIISVSADETAFLHSYLPDAAVTTIGIFPDLPPPPAYSLGGARNLAEVISSCGPSLPQYRWSGAGEAGAAAEQLRLATLRSLDLVYVSSNHLANVSGLRWFLEQVYLPHLAPAGVSMIVAGSIREAFDWPHHDRLFFVGRLERLEPLYAAARLVVLPVLEGAGAAVKTAEALNTCRAIIGTPVAFRGMSETIDGVELAVTAREFTAGIRHLLADDGHRRERGQAVQRSAAQLRDPQRYANLMDGVFRAALGDSALVVARTPSSAPLQGDYLEWDGLIEHLNRVVRGWLAGEPIEVRWLALLADYPPARLERTLRAVLDAVIDTRSAPLLNVDHTLLESVAQNGRQASDTLFGLISEAIAMYRPTGTPPRPGLHFLYYPGVPTSIRVKGAAAAEPLMLQRANEPPSMLHEGQDGWLQTEIASEAGRLRPYPAFIEAGSAALTGILRQSVPLTEGADGEVASVLASGDLRAVRNMQIGMGGTLLLPRLVAAGASGRWLDLVLGEGSTLDLDMMIDGTRLPAQRVRQDGRLVFRYALPPLGTDGVLSHLAAQFTCIAGTGSLFEAVQTLTFGPVTAMTGIQDASGHSGAATERRQIFGQPGAELPSLASPGVQHVMFGKWLPGRGKRDKVRTFTRRGDAARDIHDWVSAQKAYEAALHESPKLAHVWVQLGHAQKEQGLLSEALSAYSKANALQPGNADTLHQIARTQDRLGQQAEALAHYERALALEPLRADASQEARDLRQRMQSTGH